MQTIFILQGHMRTLRFSPFHIFTYTVKTVENTRGLINIVNITWLITIFNILTSNNMIL